MDHSEGRKKSLWGDQIAKVSLKGREEKFV